ncbi:uncharacterized protein PV09_07751 [Verruconis gallopava]|uniref:Uncharacterized protein n=1 Tax=Verruconis gallopava TaxID=253628 RepID=A0A0D2A307_9PEZI|nr:uncharacterized protein PV09_07751 [Verruconis gallopava]KIW00770.1 hypothetical protein PV09_07751 [Verruconis gallopava]
MTSSAVSEITLTLGLANPSVWPESPTLRAKPPSPPNAVSIPMSGLPSSLSTLPTPLSDITSSASGNLVPTSGLPPSDDGTKGPANVSAPDKAMPVAPGTDTGVVGNMPSPPKGTPQLPKNLPSPHNVMPSPQNVATSPPTGMPEMAGMSGVPTPKIGGPASSGVRTTLNNGQTRSGVGGVETSAGQIGNNGGLTSHMFSPFLAIISILAGLQF